MLKVIEKIPAASSTFDEAAPAARLKVLETKKRAARAAWLAGARAGTAITVNREIIDAIP